MSIHTRVSLDLTTHAASAITASKRFAKKLFLHGYAWAGEEVLETVEQDGDSFYCWFIERTES